MWVHFETFHEIFRPTYMTKYPPGQSLAMALGQRLLGHPWYGVLISFALMSACLCWMLQGWVAPIYALLTSIVAIGQLGILRYWMDSYWGGAVAAIGGCLVLGSIPRLARRPNLATTCGFALGLVILANSRPFEGLVTAVAGFTGLIWWRRRKHLPLMELARPTRVIAALAILGAGAAATAYYNYRVTGSPVRMPHKVYEDAYTLLTEYFYFLPPKTHQPVYHHELIRKFFVDVDAPMYYKIRHNPLIALYRVWFALTFIFSPITLAAFAGGALLSRGIRVLLCLAIAGAVLLAMALEVTANSHYYAPAIGAFFIPVAIGLYLLRRAGRGYGPALVLLYVVAVFTTLPVQVVQESHRPDTPREQVLSTLKRAGGRHLILVRYAPDHSPHIEFVFNQADIDGSKVIWARDMGAAANRELLDYYPDRKVWLLEPDRSLVPQVYNGQ